jgi:hypothetical protein
MKATEDEFAQLDGVAMMNSFAKDWARWSSAERLTVKLVGFVGLFGIASEALLHVV